MYNEANNTVFLNPTFLIGLNRHISIEKEANYTLNAGAHDTVDLLIRMDPLEPIFIMTHFVRSPLLINASPA